MDKIKKIIFLSILVFVLQNACITKTNFVFCEPKDELEFVLQGIRYNLSLIQDASVEFELTYKNSKEIKSGKWFYKDGKEKVFLKAVDESKNINEIIYIYTPENTYIINFEKGKIASVTMGYSPYYIQLKIRPTWVPSSILFHLWPVGITLEEILQNEKLKILSNSEYFAGSKCFVVEVPSFGFKEFKGYGKDDYSYLGYKIWFSVEEGFLPKKIEIYRQEDLIISVGPINFEKFSIDKDIWFPGGVSIKWYDPSSKKISAEGKMVYSNIKVNQGIKDEEFNLTFPPGIQVYDERTGISFTVPEKN